MKSPVPYKYKNAKYISFDFSDCEDNDYHVIVRINKDIAYNILKKIGQSVQNKIDDLVAKGEYWDCDEILIDGAMKAFARQYGFTYEFVEIDYFVDCN